MTLAKVVRQEQNIKSIEISGHAFYSDYGNDIVCSAISMVAYTIGNKLLEVDEKNVIIDIKEGLFKVEILNTSHDLELLISTLETGLLMLNEQYEDNIKIEEVTHV